MNFSYAPRLNQSVKVESGYDNYHQRIQEMAYDKRWSREDFMDALANREVGE